MVFRILCCVAAEVLLQTKRCLISLTARCIPRKKNVLVAQLSRPNQILPTEWSLFLRGFEAICRVFGHPVSFSLPPIPMLSFLYTCLRLQTRWHGSKTRPNTLRTIYQPMPSLLLLSRVLSLVPVALLWPHKGWFADLLSLLVNKPLGFS